MRGELHRDLVEGFVLVGGEGRRLGGRYKGLLRREREPLVRRLTRLLLNFSAQVTLLGPPEGSPMSSERRSLHLEATRGLEGSVRWATDLPFEGRGGSLRALRSALSLADRPWLWVLSVDLPLLSAVELSALCEGLEARHLGHIYEVDHHLHPLVGLWSKAAGVHIEALWSQGSALQALRGASWLKVSSPEVPERLMNLNYPCELERLQRRYPELSFTWE